MTMATIQRRKTMCTYDEMVKCGSFVATVSEASL